MAPAEPAPSRRLTGEEAFHTSGRSLGFDVLDFWRWSSSDLAGNVLRGRLAEYLVARALNLAADCRVEWDACDLRGSDGLAIEVKSAAYVQSWSQARASRIVFGIQPRYGWDAATNTSSAERRRTADLYVFCLLHHSDRETLNSQDLSQWTFYVLSTRVLDHRVPRQKTISLSALLALGPIECGYDELADAVRKVTEEPQTGNNPQRALEMELAIRPATESDRGFAYEVKRAALGPYVEQLWGWDEPLQQAFHARTWEARRPDIIVIDGQDAGTVQLVRRDADYLLGEFYLLPRYQRQGVGSRLMRRMLAAADAEGLPVRLQVIQINPAKALYERHGFRVSGQTATHFLMERAPHPPGAPPE